VKNEEILVTVIVPVYNVAPYLKRCVDSVRKQTHINLEIILVDDGSTDNSGALCDEFAAMDNRIAVIHKENAGLGMARNSGLDAANGEWVCFPDSDDFIHERFVEILLNAGVSNNCLIALAGFQMGMGDDFQIEQFDESIKLFDWRSCWLYCYTQISPTMYSPYSVSMGLYKKNLFNALRFQTLKMAEDVAIAPMLLWESKDKPIVLSSQVLYYYYQRQQSISRGKTSLDYIDKIEAFDQFYSFLYSKNEIGFADIIRAIRYAILVNAYIDLSRDMPEQKNFYEHLHSEITSNLSWAKENMDDDYKIFASITHAADFHKILCRSNNRFVLYGYGAFGRDIYQWLRYWNVNVIEVWDRAYKQGNKLDDVLINPPHDGFEKDVIVLLSLGNPYVRLTVKAELKNLGYCNVWGFETVCAVVRYGKYAEFLPELLEGCL